MMNPLEVYSTYMAVKLHFDKGKYDAFKFNFKGPTQKRNKFLSSPDRFAYEKITKRYSKKEELILFFLSNYIAGNTWIRDMDHDTYLEWYAKIQSMQYRFNRDMNVIYDYTLNYLISFDDCLSPQKNSIPIFDLYRKGSIQLETLVILDVLVGFVSNINKRTVSDPLGILSDTAHLITCYKPFIKMRINVSASKNIILNLFTDNTK